MFHGADNDVLWLQRDFHIYVVNLFDTAKVSFSIGFTKSFFNCMCPATSYFLIFLRVIALQACELLLKPQKSLAYLLETYCGVTTNKLLQVCP